MIIFVYHWLSNRLTLLDFLILSISNEWGLRLCRRWLYNWGQHFYIIYSYLYSYLYIYMAYIFSNPQHIEWMRFEVLVGVDYITGVNRVGINPPPPCGWIPSRLWWRPHPPHPNILTRGEFKVFLGRGKC